MKKTAKKVLSLLLCAILCISMLPLEAFAEDDAVKEEKSSAAEAELTPEAAPEPAEETEQISVEGTFNGSPAQIDANGNLLINEENFPDDNFRSYISTNFDTDNQGYLTAEQVAGVKTISCYGKSIASLNGVEYFTELTSLSCEGNQLTELDVSNNTALTNLGCSSNQLTELDVSNNTALTSLSCGYNNLSTLDVSNNTALASLSCGSNQLSSLDVSNNTALKWLHCDTNQLTELDVSKNTKLTSLGCYENQLLELNVSQNTSLTWLACSNNQLSSLDVSNSTALATLWCSFNQLTTLDVSQNAGLTELSCHNNQLSTLDVSNSTVLNSLDCSSNQLNRLDVSNSPALTILDCNSNQLTTLDISHNTDLTSLNCNSNQLNTLDVSNNTALIVFSCGSNQLTALDVSQNTALTYLGCGFNQLTELDVSNNTALTTLRCDDNLLSALDVSKNTALEGLVCQCNNLATLDVSNNTALTAIECACNQLSALDVSNNTALIWLNCGSNQITALDVSRNTELTDFYCYSNHLPSLDLSQNTKLSTLYCSGQTSAALAEMQGSDCIFDLGAMVGSENLDRVTNLSGGTYDSSTGLVTLDIEDGATTAAVVYDYDHQSVVTESIMDVTVNLSLTEESADGVVASGTCGENVTWTLYDSGAMEVSGDGEIAYSFSMPWEDYKDEIISLTIDDGVTGICMFAFYGCRNLSSVQIPGSVTSIGGSAFDNCSSLCSLTISDGVTEIQNGAFANCPALTEVFIPASVASIGRVSFANCTGMTAFTVDEANACYCSDEDGVLFSKDKTQLVQYPLARGAASYTVPDGVEVIWCEAFASCTGLKELILPDGLKTLEPNAIRGSGIERIHLPASVSTLENGALVGSESLREITVDEANENFCVGEQGELLNKEQTRLLALPTGYTGRYVVPNTITAIQEYAGDSCKKLTDLKIPGTVTEIGLCAFGGCTGLSSLCFEHQESDSLTIGMMAFSTYDEPAEELTIYVPDAENINPAITAYNWGSRTVSYYPIGDGYGKLLYSGACGENVTWTLYSSGTMVISGTGAMENYCDYSKDIPTWTDVPWKDHQAEITEVIIEDGVTSVGADAFRDCGNLADITLPDSVTRIGEWALSNCVSLTEIKLPPALHSIGMSAFYGCSGLKSLMIPASTANIGVNPFRDCGSLTEILVDAENTAYVSSDGVLYNGDWTALICYPAAKAGETYTVPDSVLRIGEGAFSGSSLAEIRLPERMDSIGSGAFMDCGELRSLIIPRGITVLEAGLFGRCRNLRTVTIPDGVTSLVNATFMDCWSLGSIELPDSLTTIGGFAFYSCESLAEITIPAGVTVLESCAFSNCYGMSAITFMGDAPAMAEDCFTGAYATACYFESNETWTEEVRQDYGGSITWRAVDDSGIVYSGACGEGLTWTLDVEGKLTVSGTGKMDDYSYDQLAPWFDCLARVKSVVINEGVTSVGTEAFRECRNLKSVAIPDSVTSIGDSAFYLCDSLTSIELPAATVYIGASAFQACTKLEEILVDAENTAYASEDGVLFNGDKTELICYPAARAGEEYIVPDSVLRIGEYAFSSCSLKTLLLPDKMNSIGSGAFSDCTALETIALPEGLGTIESAIFAGCSSLTGVNIPFGVTTIDGAAFMGCSSLTDMVIPGSVTAIGTYVFAGTGLTEITFRGDAPSIGDGCFTGVTATAYYPAENETWTGAVMQDYGGSITWTAMTAAYTLTGTAVSWDGDGNEVICLYSGLTEEEIQADITAGAAGASYIAQCGEPEQNADGERYNVGFRFEKVEDGGYTLAIHKPGSYTLKTLSVTVNGDMELGEIVLQLYGDISGDGTVNTMDLIRLMKYVSGETVDIAPGSGDVNGDGRENVLDLIRLMKLVNGEYAENA